MKNKSNLKIQLGAAVLGVVATTALVAGTSYAQSNSHENFFKLGKANGENNQINKRFFANDKAIKEAITNNDYDAWVEAHGDDCPDKAELTEDRFNKMVEINELLENGDKEGAQELMKEVGFRGRDGHDGERGGMMDKAIKEAITNNDYDAWVEAHGDDCPDKAELTEDRFNKMVEINELLENGDKEGAQELMKEVGFRGHGGEKGGRFMKK